MKVTLIVNNSDRKKINKSLDIKLANVAAKAKEPCNVLTPTIELDKATITQSGVSYAKINYLYIEEFGRYYFVDSVTIEPGGLLVFSASVDVLYTYRKQLLATQFEVIRSSSLYSKYFVDTQLALQVMRYYDWVKIGHIPQSSTGKKYIITVAGGTTPTP